MKGHPEIPGCPLSFYNNVTYGIVYVTIRNPYKYIIMYLCSRKNNEKENYNDNQNENVYKDFSIDFWYVAFSSSW